MARSNAYAMSTYIGDTLTGLPSPVFFDPHYPITQNRAPVSLITGEPGAGKTFLAMTLAAHASALGKTIFVLDPKGDFLSLKKLSNAGEINKVNVWSIFSNEDNQDVAGENVGLLDPMQLKSKRSDNIALTIDIIGSLVGNMTDQQSNALLPIVQDVAESSDPTLSRVIRQLNSSQNDSVRNLGTRLAVPLENSIAKLLVSDGHDDDYVNPFIKADGTTVISLMGLTLPNPSESESEYTNEERLSTVVMRLLTQLIIETMGKLPKTIEKFLIVDEAWVVFGNSYGRNLIKSTSLLGRSLNMSILLATQSPRHLIEEGTKNSDLDTAISTRFAFRNNNEEDNYINCRAMRLPEDGGWEELMPQLSEGMCLMKDCTGGLALIKVHAMPAWIKAFDTNPAAKRVENNKNNEGQ